MSVLEEDPANVNFIDAAPGMDIASPEDREDVYLYPAQIEKHLDFLCINTVGHLLLGSSNLAGRYWNGSVWYYRDPHTALNIDHANAAREFNGGLSDGTFINDRTAVVGQDGGTVNFLSFNVTDENIKIVQLTQVEEHGSGILSVKVTCDKKSALTASMDKSIKIWDCESGMCRHTYMPAHASSVTSLSPHPSNPQIFLSTSLDGNVLLWDFRYMKPASCVYRDTDDAPSCIMWLPDSISENGGSFLVGTHSGSLHLRKSSTIGYNLSTFQNFSRPVYRMESNPDKHNIIAVCGNETKVSALEVAGEELRLKYEDDRHLDFVRGIAWLSPKSFLTCGWDKNVITHLLG